jgi:hypothetical protein
VAVGVNEGGGVSVGVGVKVDVGVNVAVGVGVGSTGPTTGVLFSAAINGMYKRRLAAAGGWLGALDRRYAWRVATGLGEFDGTAFCR